MNYNMLQGMKWDYSHYAQTYGKYKRHDTTTWMMLKAKVGANREYFASIKQTDNEQNPLVLHMGGVVGSMCNTLNSSVQGPIIYQEKKKEFIIKESHLKEMTPLEIYNKYKSSQATTIW